MQIYHDLESCRAGIAGQEEPSAVALGCFDGVHLGHQQVIRSAAACAGLRPWVFTFDNISSTPQGENSIRCGKGAMLLTTRAKYKLLEQMGVEAVLAPAFADLRDMDAETFVHVVLTGLLGAEAVFCGRNFRFGREAKGDTNLLERLGKESGMKVFPAEHVTAPGGRRISSTAIRQAVSQGEMERAAEMLGRPYSIDFTVIHGRQLGRKLDFPTINQPYPEGFCIPRKGVYAAIALVDGIWRPAVTNVGVKPTVGSDQVLAETYIIGCEQDLYGCQVEVGFLTHMRDEQKFNSLEELRENIHRDADYAAEIGRKYLSSGGALPGNL